MAAENAAPLLEAGAAAKSAKNMNSGVRVVGSRVLDSENGTRRELGADADAVPDSSLLLLLTRRLSASCSCHQCRQKSLAEKKQARRNSALRWRRTDGFVLALPAKTPNPCSLLLTPSAVRRLPAKGEAMVCQVPAQSVRFRVLEPHTPDTAWLTATARAWQRCSFSRTGPAPSAARRATAPAAAPRRGRLLLAPSPSLRARRASTAWRSCWRSTLTR